MKVVLTVFPMPILCDWFTIVFASPSFHLVIDAFRFPLVTTLLRFATVLVPGIHTIRKREA
jgi:hypothetical protein